MNIARFLLGITSIFAYPMDNYVSRHCVQTIIIKYKQYQRSLLSPSAMHPTMYYHPAVSNPSHSTTPSSSSPPSPHAVTHIPPRVIELSDINKLKTFSNGDIQVRRRAPSSTTITTSTSTTNITTNTNTNTTNTTNNNIMTDISTSSATSTAILSLKSPLQSFKIKSIKSAEDIETLAIITLQNDDNPIDIESINSSRNLLSSAHSTDALNNNRISLSEIMSPKLHQNIPNNKTYNEISATDDRNPYSTNNNNNNTHNITSSTTANTTDNNINYSYSYSYEHELPPCEYVLLSIFLWGTSLSFALIFTNLGLVLALTGAVAASVIGFVLPGLIYIRAYQIEFHEAILFTFDITLSSSYYHINTNTNTNLYNNHIYHSAPLNNTEDSINAISNKNVVKNPMNLSINTTNTTSDNNSNNNNNNDNSNSSNIQSSSSSSSDINNHLYQDTESERDENNHINSNNNNNNNSHTTNINNRHMDLENSHTNTVNEINTYRNKSIYQRITAFYDFYLPVFLVLFGITALITGVGTVLSQNNR